MIRINLVGWFRTGHENTNMKVTWLPGLRKSVWYFGEEILIAKLICQMDVLFMEFILIEGTSVYQHLPKGVV